MFKRLTGKISGLFSSRLRLDNISIKAKLMVIITILILYPIVIIGYFGYRNYADITKENFISYSRQNADELSHLLTDRVESLNYFSRQIIRDKYIYDFEKQLSDATRDSGIEFILHREFESHLQSILLSKPELESVVFRFSEHKKVFYSSNISVSSPDFIVQMDKLYDRAKSGKGKPVWYFARNRGSLSGIYMAQMVYDIHTHKEIGILIFSINQNYLFDIFKNFLSNKEQNIAIYTGDNFKLFEYKSFNINYSGPESNLINSLQKNTITERAIGSDKVYFIYNAVEAIDCKSVVSISSNILLKEVRDISKFIVLLCVITLPLCVILLNFLYIDMVRPMNKLIKKMYILEKGTFGVTIENDRKDELGYVFRTFNKMSIEINNLINRVYKEEIAMKDAEIKALQAQINPHFLYNTLEAINWKAKINGVEEISEMVSALSSIIEANLNRSNEKYIPVSKEIKYINSYNLLIQKRFGKKINFEMEVEPETEECIIPKLLLQPVMENSVYHGLEPKKGGGTIRLSIKREDDKLLITVSDDGVGISPDILEKLRAYMEDSKLYEEQSKGKGRASIGVINVHRRIQLLYGNQYGMDISSLEGEGTTTVIKLPYHVL